MPTEISVEVTVAGANNNQPFSITSNEYETQGELETALRNLLATIGVANEDITVDFK